MRGKSKKIIAIPDLHFPFIDSDALKEVYKAIKSEKPDIIVQLGDLYDQYCFSRFDRDLNVIAPKEEIQAAKAMSKIFWTKIRKASDADLYQLCGNHDIRFAKKILNKLPELSYEIAELRGKYYNFEGVKTFYDDREFLEIDNIIFVHGWLGGNKKHMKHFGKSVVRAHSHSAELYLNQSYNTEYNLHFEMQCGCLINESAVPFNYTSSTMTKWKHAFGIIENGFPRLVIL